MTQGAWTGRPPGSWGPDCQRGMSLATIAHLRIWLKKSIGASSVLVMERVDGRNCVRLRITLGCETPKEIEVAALDALRRRKLKGPQLEQMLREAICGV